MMLTNDQVFRRLKEERVAEVCRGAVENLTEDYCLVRTKKGNIFLLGEPFFDSYGLEEVLSLCYGEETVRKINVYKRKKGLSKKVREERFEAHCQ